MQRAAITVALVAAVGLGGACKSKKNQAKPSAGSQAAVPVPARPVPGALPVLPKPTEEDPNYEANRAELLRRGNPEMMKDAPVALTTAPDIKAADLIKPIGKDKVQIGLIKVDLAAGRAEIPAKVAALEQPLEYVAVAENGKAYESLLIVNITSIELRLALSLMGYEGVTPAEGGAVPAPTASSSVLLSAIVGGKERPLAAYLIDRRTKKQPIDSPWQVIGFRQVDRDQSLLTKDFFTLVARDYFAPVRYTEDTGNPYAGPDQGYGGNLKLLPPKGGELTLVIKRRPDMPKTPTDSPDMMMPGGMPGGTPGMPTGLPPGVVPPPGGNP